MNLTDILSKRKEFLLKKWIDSVMEIYPTESIKSLQSKKDRFHNPVGHTISFSIGAIFDKIIAKENNSDELSKLMDGIIRITAIQDFTPSQALSFIYKLKRIIRDELKKEGLLDDVFEELLYLESRIDELAFLAFDIYMKCREKVYELKVNELRNSTFMLLKTQGTRQSKRPRNQVVSTFAETRVGKTENRSNF